MYGISLFLSLSPKKKGFRIIKQIPCSHLTLVRKIFERTKNWKDLYFHEDSKKDFFFFFKFPNHECKLWLLESASN